MQPASMHIYSSVIYKWILAINPTLKRSRITLEQFIGLEYAVHKTEYPALKNWVIQNLK